MVTISVSFLWILNALQRELCDLKLVQGWKISNFTLVIDNDRPFLSRGYFSNEIRKMIENEFAMVFALFCGTVITSLFELGVSHLDLEVSKFNFWSLMFHVVLLTCLFFPSKSKSTYKKY